MLELDGCIIRNGYGQIRINNISYLPYRLVYELTCDSIPEGMLVLHSCDNRKCCNLNHLFLGTNQDNTDDMISKGRQKHTVGEKNGDSKLIEKDILEIRKKYKWYIYTQKQLAVEYNVTDSTINRIINYRSWKYI